MKKVIAFFVDKDLGVSLALWAIKYKIGYKTEFLILCKEENKKYFKKMKAKIVGGEKEAFNFKPDIIFSINFWEKIEKKYIRRFKIINLHHSYNLTYRGRHSCSWAIINARKHNNWLHGTTLHIIDENIDCGQVICSYSCPIFEDDTAYSLFLRVEKLAQKMFRKNYLKILKGDYQVKKLPCSKFYYRESDLNHFIDLTLPAIDIYDRVRALTFPGKPLPYTVIKNKKIEMIWKGETLNKDKLEAIKWKE